MNKEQILSVKNISKTYFKSPSETISALNDLSFDLFKGEILGIIGRNGAGKSTLLKVLSQITPPSSGSIEYEGTLSSIIEIGTGFHPDLSGRDNVYLSASLLGLTKKEVDAIYPEIVKFSGLEEFMDMPVKHFSSGMYLRLAFAVAFYSKIDILLLDEVIAVGDASFKRKCYDKIRNLKKEGVAIVLISHSMESILEFCDRCLWLEYGQIKKMGEVLEVVECYLEQSEKNSGLLTRKEMDNQEIQNSAITYLQDFSTLSLAGINKMELELKAEKIGAISIGAEQAISIELSIEKSTDDSFEIAYELLNMNGTRLFLDSYAMRKSYVVEKMEKGTYLIQCIIPAKLLSKGVYYLGAIVSRNGKFEIHLEKIARFRIETSEKMLFGKELNVLIQPELTWEIKQV